MLRVPTLKNLALTFARAETRSGCSFLSSTGAVSVQTVSINSNLLLRHLSAEYSWTKSISGIRERSECGWSLLTPPTRWQCSPTALEATLSWDLSGTNPSQTQDLGENTLGMSTTSLT